MQTSNLQQQKTLSALDCAGPSTIAEPANHSRQKYCSRAEFSVAHPGSYLPIMTWKSAKPYIIIVFKKNNALPLFVFGTPKAIYQSLPQHSEDQPFSEMLKHWYHDDNLAN
jgi:hypothetical protein